MFSRFDGSSLAGSVGGVNYPFSSHSPLRELTTLSDDGQNFPGMIEFISVTQMCCYTLVCFLWL